MYISSEFESDTPSVRGGAIATFDARWPGLRRRLTSMAVAILLEIGLVLLLLTLGTGVNGDPKRSVPMTSVSFAPQPEPQPSETPDRPKAAGKPSALVPQPRPAVPQPTSAPTVVPLPIPMPAPAAVIPVNPTAPAPAAPTSGPAKIGVRMRDDASGPAGPAGVSMSGDSQVVGSGPHGEPVYGARWYREPTQQELRGYLSTVSEPGWALINCKTAPQWRVEECYLLDQNPDPSNLGRAVLAATWQFQVRPPQVGGKAMVGSWVRIRIDYQLRRSKAPDG